MLVQPGWSTVEPGLLLPENIFVITDSPSPELLAVVEVDPSQRVNCQAPGCGHPVYKRIHVVRNEGVLGVLGSDCFARLFAKRLPKPRPSYGGSDGRLLTAAERTLLAENTERLLEQFADEQARAADEQRKRLDDLRRVWAIRVGSAAPQTPAAPLPKSRPDFRRPPPQDDISSVEAEAKRNVRDKFGVNPDEPGWRGLVLTEAWKLLGR